MGFAKFVVVACLLSSVLLGAAALNVIVGQDIDFQCHTEDGYAPEFQRQADDNSWTTLFTGDAPRPGTDRARWFVKKDDASVFHYRLLNATLDDGGHYRCNSVSEVHHPLRVVSTRLECGELPLDAFVDSTFRPVCRVATSGPESGHAESTKTPLLKWVVGDEAEGKNLTTTHSASAVGSSEATLTADLTHEFHGKDLSCILDMPTMEGNSPKCTLGPLNISFPVKSKRLDETRIEDCHSFEMLFFANPAPVASLLSLEDPSGRVEFSFDTLAEDEGIAANLRACGLESDVEAVLSYDGEAVELLTFLSPDSSPTTVATTTEGDVVETADAGSSTEAVVAAIVVILLLAAGGGAFAFYVLRIRKDGRGVVGDEEAGVVEEKKGEKEEGEEELKEEAKEEEQNEEENKADVEGENEAEAVPEKVAIEDVAKDVVESEAELKSKLSALEDVEGVKMIDDSINEGKEDEEEKQKIRSDEKVDV